MLITYCNSFCGEGELYISELSVLCCHIKNGDSWCICIISSAKLSKIHWSTSKETKGKERKGKERETDKKRNKNVDFNAMNSVHFFQLHIDPTKCTTFII
jgi:hypothetical protein